MNKRVHSEIWQRRQKEGDSGFGSAEGTEHGVNRDPRTSCGGPAPLHHQVGIPVLTISKYHLLPCFILLDVPAPSYFIFSLIFLTYAMLLPCLLDLLFLFIYHIYHFTTQFFLEMYLHHGFTIFSTHYGVLWCYNVFVCTCTMTVPCFYLFCTFTILFPIFLDMYLYHGTTFLAHVP